MQANRWARRSPPDRLAGHPLVLRALRDRVRAEYPLPRRRDITYELFHRQAVVGVQLLPRRLPLYRPPSTADRNSSCPPPAVSPSPIPPPHRHCRQEGRAARMARTTDHLPVNTPQCLWPEGLRTCAARRHRADWAAESREIYADPRLRRRRARRGGVQAGGALSRRSPGRALPSADEHATSRRGRLLSRWLLVNASAPGRMLRFLSSPLWRAYHHT